MNENLNKIKEIINKSSEYEKLYLLGYLQGQLKDLFSEQKIKPFKVKFTSRE